MNERNKTNMNSEAFYIKIIRDQIDHEPVVTVAIKECEGGYAVGTAVLGMTTQPWKQEGTNRAKNRCRSAAELGQPAGYAYATDLFYWFKPEDIEFLAVAGILVKVRKGGPDIGTVKGIGFHKLNVVADVPNFVKEMLQRKHVPVSTEEKHEETQ